MSLFATPHLYFVSRTATLQITNPPPLPFSTDDVIPLVQAQVNAGYTRANLGTTWETVVAWDAKSATAKGIAKLAPVTPPAA